MRNRRIVRRAPWSRWRGNPLPGPAYDPTIVVQAGIGESIGSYASVAAAATWTRTNISYSVPGGFQTFTPSGAGVVEHKIAVTGTSMGTLPGPARWSIVVRKPAGSALTAIGIVPSVPDGTNVRYILDSASVSILGSAGLDGNVEVLPLGNDYWQVTFATRQCPTGASTWEIRLLAPLTFTESWDQTLYAAAPLEIYSVSVYQPQLQTWDDMRGNGRLWTATSTGARPISWIDSRGPCVVFDVQQTMQADSLAAAFGGVSVPHWCLACVDGVTREAFTRVLWGFAPNIAADCNTTPNYDLTNSRVWRNGAGPGWNTTGRTGGAWVHRYDGVNIRGRWGTMMGGSIASAGLLNASWLSIGASRYGPGPATSALFRGRIRTIGCRANDILTDALADQFTNWGQSAFTYP